MLILRVTITAIIFWVIIMHQALFKAFLSSKLISKVGVILLMRKLRLRLSNLLTICVESYGSNINLMVLRPAFSSSLLNCGHDGGYSLLSALEEQRNISLGLIILFVKPRKKTNYFCLLQWENRNPIPYKCFLLKYKLVS